MKRKSLLLASSGLVLGAVAAINGVSAQSVTGFSAESVAIPPNAEPGKCYARVVIPAQYRSVTQRVVDKEAGNDVRVSAAQYRTVTETVVVEEASERLEVVPATYRTVTETVEVQEPSE